GFKVKAYNFIDENKKNAQYWRDIGTLDAYYEANMDLIQVDPVFNLYDSQWPIRTYQEQTPPAKSIFAGEEITGRVGLALDSLVAGGCIISGGQVKRSVLSPNVRINSYSQVTDSILMEGVSVGRHANIKRAIIDKDVSIPEGAVIGYDLDDDRKRFVVTDSGIVVVAKRTEIK
ncbi:MAG: glucose-1-phosphate adenylyltransferase, partial [Candidatus Omnitrophica bacterium]|nr:glucose-1-phosphate adenylyltransferase [Candidatus Omnitrophota bacterium]